SFHSRPDLHPPSVTIKQKASAVSPRYTFFAPKKQVKQHGPLIVDNDGHVVWFDPLAHEATDFRVQQYQGKPVLTWWQGRSTVGNGHGHYVLMNDHYHVIKTVYATHGLDGDQHEFLLTPQGTALITAYKPVSGDVSAVGGPKRGKILDCFLQEIDVATGRLVFEWNALDHVAITESYWQLQKVKGKWPPYDFFHINSIDQEPNGDFLVSARNTHALYEIDREDHLAPRRQEERFPDGQGHRLQLAARCAAPSERRHQRLRRWRHGLRQLERRDAGRDLATHRRERQTARRREEARLRDDVVGAQGRDPRPGAGVGRERHSARILEARLRLLACCAQADRGRVSRAFVRERERERERRVPRSPDSS